MEQDRKKRERSVLDFFRNKYDRFPKGKLAAVESPDFILHVNTKFAIGIELVGIHMMSNPGSSIPDIIQELIRLKEEKLRLYRKKRLDRYWLLIYCEYREISQQIRRMPRLSTESLFNRVFLLLPGEKEMYILKG